MSTYHNKSNCNIKESSEQTLIEIPIHFEWCVLYAATHWANFDKKVHKPQYWTLEVTRVKKAKHAEKQTNYLVSK